MKHLTTELEKRIREHAVLSLVLLDMIAVDWSKVPVDTVVYASDNLEVMLDYIEKESASKFHFKGISDKFTESRFEVFSEQKSSATTAKTAYYKYCIICK